MTRIPLAELLDGLLGRPQLRITAYDGSKSGPDDARAEVQLRSPKALSYLIYAPSPLGFARAYVSGELDVVGDIHTALDAVWSGGLAQVTARDLVKTLPSIDRQAFRYVEPPATEVGARRLLSGLRHSKARDAEAISHHYDVSNQFYEYVLGPAMTYTCACYPSAESTQEQAQFHKYDLVCRKLGLQPGMRLLDVGCGWGGMVRHAATHYGVQALGVTLSRQQAEWAAKRIAEDGLTGTAEVRHLDYRDVSETDFDAISSIGLTEHIGYKSLPAYFGFLYSKLRPQGRLLNHCITRPTTTEGVKSKGFIDRYVFPDGELEAVGVLASRMQDAGFEVRHEENLREHYALTLGAWGDNLEQHWDECVSEVGIERARVWRLYMAACRVAFERRGIELHQILGVRVDDHGQAGYPLRPDFGV